MSVAAEVDVIDGVAGEVDEPFVYLFWACGVLSPPRSMDPLVDIDSEL